MIKSVVVTSCVVFAGLFHVVKLKSTTADYYYVAAVLEFKYEDDMRANLEQYLHYMAEAAKQNVDIIVFPEMTLTRLSNESVRVPIYDLLKEYPIPALKPDLYDEVLVNISSAARQHEMYVVINVQEAMDCNTKETENETCLEKKLYLFNTNVVFDRNGMVISRYRKIHLFGENGREPSLNTELAIFHTDFGVRFGHFICFDLMFDVPAVKILSDVRDVIFTTMWFSELPFLTAVQIQEAYAYTNDINLLASGANRVSEGSAGSGIYSGKSGSRISIMPGIPTTRLLVSRVPKVPGKFDITPEFPADYPGPLYDDPSQVSTLLKVDPSLVASRSKLLAEGFNSIDLWDNNIFCRFQINIKHGTAYRHYRYRVAAFSGVRTFSYVASGGNRYCGVFACTGTHISTCGSRIQPHNKESYATFSELFINADVLHHTNTSAYNDDSIYYPVSLTYTMMPLQPQQYSYRENREVLSFGYRQNHYFELIEQSSDLYSVGVWGRVFGADGQEPTPARDTAVVVMINCLLVFSSVLFHVF